MQAIITRVLPATNTRPTRIKASCARGALFYSVTHCPHNLSSEPAHRLAANALCASFLAEDSKPEVTASESVWARSFASGQLANGDWVHVFFEKEIPLDRALDCADRVRGTLCQLATGEPLRDFATVTAYLHKLQFKA